MPVKRQGKNIIEKSTGKVVGRASSKKNAAISASIRNEAIKGKKGKHK